MSILPFIARRASPGHEAPWTLPRRHAVGAVCCVAVLVLAILLSLAVGSRFIPLPEVIQGLFAPIDSESSRIVQELRIPRTVAAAIAGIGLGLAGGVIQALTRNPLGDPGILGVDAGAMIGVTVGVVFLGTRTSLQDLGFAFGGALLVTIAVVLVGSAGPLVDPVKITLAGVALAAALAGVATALRLLDPVAFARLRGWDAGSFVERGWDVILPAAPFLLVGVLLALVIARPLNALGLGEDLATALGARIDRTRIIAIVSVTLLAGTATAIAGPIGFIGLMVPHVARWIAGADQRWILGLSMLIAPAVLLIADVIGRVILYPGEVGVGIVTALIGGPALIAIVRRAKATSL